MANSFLTIALTLALVVGSHASDPLLVPKPCKPAHRPVIFHPGHVDPVEVPLPDGHIATVVPLFIKRWHGDYPAGEQAIMSMPPGSTFPIHRRPGGSEFMYVMRGSGIQTSWSNQDEGHETVHLSPGTSLYYPDHVIFTITNNGDSPLEFLLSASSTFGPVETFDDWPKHYHDQGKLSLMPWDTFCPKGQDADVHEPTHADHVEGDEGWRQQVADHEGEGGFDEDAGGVRQEWEDIVEGAV